MEFGNFSPRDAYFNVQSNDLNMGFPPIGTFSVDSTSINSNQGSSIFSTSESSQSHRSKNNNFNTSPRSVTNGGNSNLYNGNNNSSGDNQGTRETGIIEKLLVNKKRFNI